jgi:hypothetical protein
MAHRLELSNFLYAREALIPGAKSGEWHGKSRLMAPMSDREQLTT